MAPTTKQRDIPPIHPGEVLKEEFLAEYGLSQYELASNHWKWFHVLEDEISHRGQILLLRKRLPARGAGRLAPG